MPIEHKDVHLAELHFDPENPRLPPGVGADQKKIFRYLVDSIGVEDLLRAISSSGMIPSDPIIVRPRQKPLAGYYVIEGNRRLAALKLLSGEQIGDDLQAPKVPEVTPQIRSTFDPITVEQGWETEALASYLGYKHVTSAKEWSPEAKARFVKHHAAGDFSEKSLRKFAKQLGTTYPTLKRWLIADLTLDQAESNGIFDPQHATTKRYFGRFYTLLGGSEVQKFLGLAGDISVNPVPSEKLKNLEDFVAWSVGTKSRKAFLSSRHQNKLEAVLSSPRALKYFRTSRDLTSALFYTEYNTAEIATQLREASYTIEECLVKLNDVKNDSSVVEAFDDLTRAYEKAKLNMGR